MKRFHITTLGCKVNQCESAALAHLLEASGYETAGSGEPHHLVVVNTCTVTGKAAMQSRQAIRQAIRNHPEARIVVTGCYAQTAPQEIQSIPQVDLIVGHGDKMKLTQLLNRMDQAADGDASLVHGPIQGLDRFAPLPSVAPADRTRAFLKIQDGCNAYCTYCIVPYARGRSRSMPSDEILEHLAALQRQGYRETVLTGIHLGAYGHDFKLPSTLVDLLKTISSAGLMDRIRISSIEPTEVDAGLIDLVADTQTPLCPHLHIPLQSGDDQVLGRMGRPYDHTLFADVIRAVHAAVPHASIGVDVLVGFPGESDEAFEHTYELIATLPVTYLHVFPFSARAGTKAAAFKDVVPNQVIQARCRRLRRLGTRKRNAFYEANVGRRLEVLVETGSDPLHGLPKGISENYIPVLLPDASVTGNSLVTAHIDGVDATQTVFGHVETVPPARKPSN